jgi:hypothetical protein
MPTLELLIDASGMQRGATEAESALQRVKKAVESVSSASTGGSGIYGGGSRVGSSSATSFSFGGGAAGGGGGGVAQVLGGSLQSATGIAQTAQALGQLNIQAAAFGAARSAFEIGNTINDFTRFRSSVGGVTTVFGTLGAVLRANPIGAIATAIGLAATAMSFFGSRTKDTTSEVQKQVSELSKLRAALPGTEARVGLGAADPRTTSGGTIDTILALRDRNRADPRSSISIEEASRLFGISQERLRLGLEDTGIAPGVNQPSPIVRTPAIDGRGNPLGFDRVSGGTFPSEIGTGVAAQFGERLLTDRAQQERFRADGAAMDNMGASLRAAEMKAEFDAREREEEARRQAQQDAAKRIDESMERAAQFGEQIGASVGDAAAQMLFAGRSFRDVISNLVRQFATQGLQNAGAGLFRAAVQGITGPQAAANAGPPGGIGPPIPTQ